MIAFFQRRWFLLVLGAVLVLGMAFPEALAPIAQLPALRDGVVFVVLFLMAFPLKAGAMWRSLRRPGPPLLAVAINFGLLPLFAWLVSFGLAEPFSSGLLVTAATPCTLASASVWTRRAGGNDSAAILVTLITNGFCFVVTPAWTLALIGAKADISLLELMQKLGVLVVLPMLLAQLVRLHPTTGEWATRRKPALSVAAQCGILIMVFIGAIRTGQRLASDSADAALGVQMLLMIAAVLLVHTVMLLVGVALARALRMPREDQIAVGFAGSQKTLMVGLHVAIESGASILPMVAYHVGQLVIDTVAADRWREGNIEK